MASIQRQSSEQRCQVTGGAIDDSTQNDGSNGSSGGGRDPDPKSGI